MQQIPMGSSTMHSYYGGLEYRAALRSALCDRIGLGMGAVVFDHTGLEHRFVKQFAQEQCRLEDVFMLSANGRTQINLLKLMGREGFERLMDRLLPARSVLAKDLALAIYDRLEAMAPIARSRPVSNAMGLYVIPLTFGGVCEWIGMRQEKQERTIFDRRLVDEVNAMMPPEKAAHTTDRLRALGCIEDQPISHQLTKAALAQIQRVLEPLALASAINHGGKSARGLMEGRAIWVIDTQGFAPLVSSLIFETWVAIGARRVVDGQTPSIALFSNNPKELIGLESRIDPEALLVRKAELVLASKEKMYKTIKNAELAIMCKERPAPGAAIHYTDESAPQSADCYWHEQVESPRQNEGVRSLKEELLITRKKFNKPEGANHEPRIS